MSEPDELSEREVRQLRVLLSVHLNPQTTGTWYHDTIADLKAKGLVRDGNLLPELTDDGLALARTL